MTDDAKSFTSWKLDLQKYLLSDPRLKPTDKLVAICILQHVNAKTRQAFVGAETISDKTCVCLRGIDRARKRLKATKWLDWFHTKTANIYFFSDKNLNVMRDREVRQREARAEKRKQKHRPTQKDSGVQVKPPHMDSGVQRHMDSGVRHTP